MGKKWGEGCILMQEGQYFIALRVKLEAKWIDQD
jgi:hypothetical protein